MNTAAFKAVFDESDEFHQEGFTVWQDLRKDNFQIWTTNFILDETFTLFRSQLGKSKTLKLRNSIAQSLKSIRIIRIYTVDEKKAWHYFEKLPGRGISFTDCTSFVIMKRNGIKKAFTFDRDFAEAGFTVIP